MKEIELIIGHLNSSDCDFNIGTFYIPMDLLMTINVLEGGLRNRLDTKELEMELLRGNLYIDPPVLIQIPMKYSANGKDLVLTSGFLRIQALQNLPEAERNRILNLEPNESNEEIQNLILGK